MHKFTRGMPPVDMAVTKRRFRNQWDDSFLKSEEHAAIGDCLYTGQARHCAYCDVKINDMKAGHIEHLERRSDNPQRIFDWSNMFFSCNHNDSCGNFKDNERLQFNAADIVDPSVDDPADFFTCGMNGRISARNSASSRRAGETIRVFNLNNERLTGIRANIARAVSYFLESNPSAEQIDAYLREISSFDCPSVYYNLLKRKMA